MRVYPSAQFKDFPNEFLILKKLRTPAAIQDFLNAMPFNFEEHGETYWSPVMVLKNKKAHCMEGALFGAAADDISRTARQEWDAQMSFLRGADGSRYDGQLFEKFERIRQKRGTPVSQP